MTGDACPVGGSCPTYLQSTHFPGTGQEMAYSKDGNQHVCKFFIFSAVATVAWRADVALAAKPEPAIEQPEGYGNGVQDHFSLSTLFVLLFEELEAPVQFDYLSP